MARGFLTLTIAAAHITVLLNSRVPTWALQPQLIRRLQAVLLLCIAALTGLCASDLPVAIAREALTLLVNSLLLPESLRTHLFVPASHALLQHSLLPQPSVLLLE